MKENNATVKQRGNQNKSKQQKVDYIDPTQIEVNQSTHLIQDI